MIHDVWLLVVLFGVGLLVALVEIIATLIIGRGRIFPNNRRGPRS